MKKGSSLLNKMNDYQYGSYGAENLKFNAIDDLIEVEGFYSGVGKVGVCNEQNENFVRENSDLGLVRVIGKVSITLTLETSMALLFSTTRV